MKPKLLLLTFFGGAVGSAMRYGVSLAFPSQAVWLWIVNILGSLALGFINTNRRFESGQAQSFWGTGFAGGFTTLSTLITFEVLLAGNNALYVWQQVGVGVAAYWLGRFLGGERR